MTDTSTETPSDFKDRTVWLMVFGGFEVLLGLLAGGMGLLLLAMQLMMLTNPAAFPQGAQSMAFAIGFYGVIGVVFIWLGIGSILCRRWARALMLTCSSLGLAIGIVSIISMLLILPQMDLAAAGGGQEMPEGVMTFMMAVMMAFIFGIYIVLPSVFVLFYRSKHVKATCEWKDPKIRWTDKCPLPVLAVSLLCALTTVTMLGVALWLPVFATPGGMLTGLPAGIILAAIGVLFAYLTWGTYKLHPAAWWLALGTIASGFIYGAALVLTGGLDMLAYYEAAGYPAEQLEMFQAMGIQNMMQSPAMMASAVLWGCLYLGYLVYVKRFFSKGDAVGANL
jgi:hypothetical protein